MNPAEQIELARAYVALSNAHVLRLVRIMFAEDAAYASANVGEFKGREAVAAMMVEFFAKFPDVHWQTSNYHNTSANTVRFDFVMTGTNQETGEAMERTSSEALSFNEAGDITRIDVY